MNDSTPNDMTRRDLLATTGKVAAASALAGFALPAVHAAGDDLVRVVLIGCGGRGGGAAENALRTKGPVQLHAMADVFEDKLNERYKYLSEKEGIAKKVDVPKQRRYIGFDAYKEAMDGLKPGDVAILTTPPAFRWVQYKYAISKGLNVFMEKPVAVDGPTCRRMFELNKEAVKKGLKVGVGLMSRHCENRQQLFDKVRNGDLGDIRLLRAYRMHGPIGSAHVGKKPEKDRELLYQIRNFQAFLWASGGCFSDFVVHNIDECCWMKDAWPVSAKASGGRQHRGDHVDQNFDTYSVRYEFEDGARLAVESRTIEGHRAELASYLHGTKGSAVISKYGHSSGRCPVYATQNLTGKPVWMGKRDEPSPYQVEWDVLMAAIRDGKAHNELDRATKAEVVGIMGRLAAHTGQEWTYEEALKHDHEFAPNVDRMTFDSKAPLEADKDGRYPVPVPGKKGTREY